MRAAAFAAIRDALARGETVKLQGFGTFAPARRSARRGRDFGTGREVQVPARTVVRFRPAKGWRKLPAA